MKKNLLKKVASIALVSSMVMAPLNVFASSTVVPAQTGKDSTALAEVTVKGDNAAVNPIYKITLPSTLAFTLDAFNIGGNGQIYSNSYAIVNRSNVAVAVKASVSATAGTSVTLEQFDADAPPDDATKVAQVAMVLGNALESGATIDATKTVPKWTPNVTDDAARSLHGATPVDTYFLLGAAEYTGTTLKSLNTEADNGGYGGFYLTGALASHPKDNGVEVGWAAKDLSVSTVYTFTPYTAAEYSDLDKTTGAITGTKNAFSTDRKSVV